MFIDNQVFYGWSTRAEIGQRSLAVTQKAIEDQKVPSLLDFAKKTDEL